MSLKNSESENIFSKKKRNINAKIQPLSHALNKLQDTSTRAEQIAEKKGTYDHFGKYIGSLLHIIGSRCYKIATTHYNSYYKQNFQLFKINIVTHLCQVHPVCEGGACLFT